MTTQIIWLQDIRFIDVALVGGKGATLGELMWKGFPVPPGFVVTVDAYKTFFREAGILDELVDLDQLPQDELDDRCTLIWNKIQQTEIAPDLAEDLLAAYTQLADQGDSPFASVVRSSATAEDLKDASFAGQHETYYYVDQERLLRMIKHCWASLWSPRAVTYRSARRIDHTSFFMAVIVQEMIPAEISGIAFTINPVTGAQDEVIIESSWGMGAAIVDGRVIPDRYIIHRDGLTLREKRIAHKRFMVPPRLQEAGKGRLEKIPHTLRRKQSLAADQIARVARWALQAEEHFGAPQDVEWAIADGRLYVLQSRPIIATEQGELPSDLDGQYILYHPVTAHMSDPLTPLTADLLTLILPPGFHLIRGWIYYDLRSSRLLLPFKMTDHELARLLAFQAAPSFSTIKLSLLKLPVSLVLWFSTYLAFGTISARIRNMPDTFMDGFSPFCHKVEKDPAFSPITAIQRLLLQPKLFDPIGRMPLLVHLAALRYVLWLELLKRLLRRWDPDLRHDAAALLIADSHSLVSHALNEEISHLTHIADEKARVRKLLLEADLDQILPELRGEPDAQEFLEQLLDFLIRYGHLAVKELELQSIRWEENPVPVLGMIRNSLLSDPT
ncbi:hypothetical protein GF339_09190, partial [candidate division KSB3 bacterium]|nr:hypothetical protein [candidate division KSB3 bacterium]MBD3324747.1 hypothetical protein [candidate division KSB3 bacterium]